MEQLHNKQKSKIYTVPEICVLLRNMHKPFGLNEMLTGDENKISRRYEILFIYLSN